MTFSRSRDWFSKRRPSSHRLFGKSSRGRSLRMEPLEDRNLLSVSVGLGAPVLVAFDDPTATAATTFLVQSTNADVTATILHTTELKMQVHTVKADGSTGTSGEMDFLPVLATGENLKGDCNSFPSGHASTGFYLMAPAFVLYRRRPGWAAAFLLLIVAAIASYLPARRAARINPTEALRAE